MKVAHKHTPGSQLLARELEFRLLVESVKEYAIFMLDVDGRVMTWNSGAELIKGYKAEEIIGQHFSRFYMPEQVERRWPHHELTIAKIEGRFEDEGWRIRKDGTRFWANVVITTLYNEAGRHVGFSKITRDLTERRRHEEALRQSEERFRLLIEGVTDYAIFMLDTGGRVISWNAGAESIKGYSLEEILGKHFSCFYLPEDQARRLPQDQLTIARIEGRCEDEGWRIRKDGTRFWANALITALLDKDGRLCGYAKVTRDMTERKRMEAMEEGTRQVNEFLAMLAHELRNPLAPIRNAVSVMAMKRFEDPSLEWSRAVIDRQVTHLARLVDDLLDVSRITSGKIILKKEPLELAVVVDRAVEASRPLIDEHGHVLDVAQTNEPMLVEADLTRLSQALLNIINNAAKYTPRGGRIAIKVEKQGGEAVIRVADTGIGIAPHMRERIFELFMQGEVGLDRSAGGLGIGLTLARRLIHLHGGAIEVFSKGLGHGSEFVIRLPLIVEERSSAPARAGETAGSIADPRRILIVDDSRDSAESMALLLAMSGHDVRTVHDGAAALAVAAEFRPHIVLLDIGLPGMDGYEVAKRLRTMPECADASIAAMTGYGQPSDRQRARAAGMDHHLVKPIDPEALQAVLRSPRRAVDAAPH